MGGPAARKHPEKRSGRRQRLLQYVVIVIAPLARRETLHWWTAVTDRLWLKKSAGQPHMIIEGMLSRDVEQTGPRFVRAARTASGAGREETGVAPTIGMTA